MCTSVEGPGERIERDSRLVATPKFAPAPHRPQNSSGSSSALARTMRPSAVTSSTERRLSGRQSNRAGARPTPPPRSARRRPCGRRPLPGRRARAPGPRCRACLAAPAASAGEPARRVDADGIHPPRSMTRPPSVVEWPTALLTAAADGDLEVALATEGSGDDVVDVQGPDDHGRSTIEHRVPDPPGIVVAGGIGVMTSPQKSGENSSTTKGHAVSLTRPAVA